MPSPIFFFFFAFLTISLASGLVYGFPALRRLLILEETSLSEKDLGIIFTIGSWCVQGGRFFSGIARDRYFGTRKTAAFCLFATAMGCTGLAFCNESSLGLLSFSFFLVGIGSGSQLCLQPVAGLFRKSIQGTILASFSGAFQVSGLVFLVLTKITERRSYGLGIFAIVLMGFVIVSLQILPVENFDSYHEEEEVPQEENSRLRSSNYVSNSDGKDEEHHIQDEEEKEEDRSEESLQNPFHEEEEEGIKEESEADIKKKGVMHLIKSKEYILLLVWFSSLLVPLQYYVATIGFQLERKGDTDGKYTALFSILYASAAVLAPFFGKIADAFGLGIGQSLATILTSCSMFILSSSNIALNSHIAGLTLYGIGRMITFGLFFTNLGKRFGFEFYGTLAGLGLLISSIFGNLQYPLIALAVDGHEKIVDIACGAFLLLQGLPYCYWLNRIERKEK